MNYLLGKIKTYHQSVYAYATSTSMPKEISKNGKLTLKAGDVLLATNIAGRGTNIGVLNNKKGIHVVLTYMPGNIRVED